MGSTSGVSSKFSAVLSLPAPWSLEWREDGELAPQDRFDLLQTLVATETLEVQVGLISALESLAMQVDITATATPLSCF